MGSDEGQIQTFTVTITWSPESDIRLTEGDIQEAIEQIVLEIDEESSVEAAEGFDHH